ncbi:uncharacterized protein LOC128238292 [Mya arenaria]|uniref:uncharacterized protein LOC128238292 n=1 Tax=Mya arenaria TaxID=6604 RepID=UPI0022E37734|nr:uncharacterized protein LOC128238292 [Mya arenaria]
MMEIAFNSEHVTACLNNDNMTRRENRVFVIVLLLCMILLLLNFRKKMGVDTYLKKFSAGLLVHESLSYEQMKELHITDRKGGNAHQLHFPGGIKAFQKTWSQFGQDIEIDRLLKQKRNGFFIELGGYDGEKLSNTLFFEMERNWTGLLIEANPYLYSNLIQKNRACYTVNCCISADMSNMTFVLADYLTSAAIFMTDAHRNDIKRLGTKGGGAQYGEKVTVTCHSLQDLLGAIGVWQIDFFSLDVEGAELHILKSIDWDKVNVDVFLIETNKSNTIRKNIIEFMKSVNYDHIGKLLIDDIFRKQK